MTDVVETTEETESKRRGPKPNPVARVNRAKAKLEKARRDAARVADVAAKLAAAEAEYAEAVAALQADLADLGIDTDSDVVAGAEE